MNELLNEKEVRETVRAVIKEELVKRLILEVMTASDVLQNKEAKKTFAAFVLRNWKEDIAKLNAERAAAGEPKITAANAADLLLTPVRKPDPDNPQRVLTSYLLLSPNTLINTWETSKYATVHLPKVEEPVAAEEPEAGEAEEAPRTYKAGEASYKAVAEYLASVTGTRALSIPAIKKISDEADKWIDAASKVIKLLDKSSSFTGQKAVEVLKHISPELSIDDLTSFARLIDACEDVAIKLFVLAMEGMDTFQFDAFFKSLAKLASTRGLKLETERPQSMAEYEAISEIWDLVAAGDFKAAGELLKQKSDEPYFALLRNLTAAVCKKVLANLTGIQAPRGRGRPPKAKE